MITTLVHLIVALLILSTLAGGILFLHDDLEEYWIERGIADGQRIRRFTSTIPSWCKTKPFIGIVVASDVTSVTILAVDGDGKFIQEKDGRTFFATVILERWRVPNPSDGWFYVVQGFRSVVSRRNNCWAIQDLGVADPLTSQEFRDRLTQSQLDELDEVPIQNPNHSKS